MNWKEKTLSVGLGALLIAGIGYGAVKVSANSSSTQSRTDATTTAQQGFFNNRGFRGQMGAQEDGRMGNFGRGGDCDADGQMMGRMGQRGDNGEEHGMYDVTNMPAQPLSDAEKADLLHMREEEKLARDVYTTLYEKWDEPVFDNISHAEQMHMDAIGTLLDKYDLSDPVAQTNDQVGVFTDEKLQDLYNQLVAQGSESVESAFKVGATIEDLDIKDLDDALARTDNDDLKVVFTRLEEGSEHHMRAFVSNLQRVGSDYQPQYITQEQFDEILSGSNGHGGPSWEKGGQQGGHPGQGHGSGRGGGR